MFKQIVKLMGSMGAIEYFVKMALDMTPELREKLIEWAKAWFLACKKTEPEYDELLPALALDLLSIGQMEWSSIVVGELRDLLDELYKYCKTTENKWDDQIVVAVYELLDLPTPVSD